MNPNPKLVAVIKVEEAIESMVRLCKEDSAAIPSLQTMIYAWRKLTSKTNSETPE